MGGTVRGGRSGRFERALSAAWTPERKATATYRAYRGLAAVMGHVPEPAALAGARAASRLVLARSDGRRAMYERHLAKVLDRPLDHDEVTAWARRVFANYARYWVEGARLGSMPGTTVDARMSIESGYEHLQAAMAGGAGAIVALPHLGSWEWGGAWLARRGYPMTAVAEVLEPEDLYRWFVAQRAAIGLTIVPLDRTAGPALLRTLRGGGLVGLVADRDLLGTGVEVEFFGDATTMPAGPATLALRTGAALLPVAVYQGPGRSHTGVILPPIDTARTADLRSDVHRVTQQLATAFEGLVRRAPDQWYCFQPMWPEDHADRAGGTGIVAGGGTAGSDETSTSTVGRDAARPGPGGAGFQSGWRAVRQARS
ncbi:MAG: phosphatidylinositol mannoside acyltransferase [Actinomycetota bacterium]|nr:phosphatidylinositol mannoside acyltransferase [Actinomycetota bacterium]